MLEDDGVLDVMRQLVLSRGVTLDEVLVLLLRHCTEPHQAVNDV